ncbi:MAG: hypothetical protein WAN65_17425, partial [Candidatus Sulfotelmatobacter sp.]
MRSARSAFGWPKSLGWMLLAISAIFASPMGFAQNPKSQPILFVHGYCGSAFDFQPLLTPLYQQLPSNLYPNQTVYYVSYNSSSNVVSFYILANGLLVPVNESSIPSTARFFSIIFYDPVSNSTDSADVVKISVLNKANELSEVINQITIITKAKNVILVAHSMGGLDARAYIENMASAGACYDYQNNVPDYGLISCVPGSSPYKGNIASLITVDTPHAGAPIAELNTQYLEPILGACIADSSTNRSELNLKALGGSGLVEALDYDGSTIAGVSPSKNGSPIEAVEDYFSDTTNPWDNFNGFLDGYSDDVVTLPSQSIKANLSAAHSTAALQDVPVSYLSNDSGIAGTAACWVGGPLDLPMLHFMTCLGAQSNTQAVIVSEVNGYVSTTVITKSATAVTASSALLSGTINPEGDAGQAYFYYGTSPTLLNNEGCGTSGTGYCPVTAGSKAEAFSFTPTGLQSNTTYYYQIQFYDSYNSNMIYGSILSFTTNNPLVTETAAARITASSALLSGTINPEGDAGQAYFAYGTSATTLYSFGCGTSGLGYCQVTASSEAEAFSFTPTGLQSNTTYYFQIQFYDTNNGNTVYGSVLSFTTKNPVLTETAAARITASSALLSGTINPEGDAGQAYFAYGTSATTLYS